MDHAGYVLHVCIVFILKIWLSEDIGENLKGKSEWGWESGIDNDGLEGFLFQRTFGVCKIRRT